MDFDIRFSDLFVMTIYSQINSNRTKTWLVMILFTVFITTLVYVFGEANGYGLSYAGIALIISGLMSFGSYIYSDKIILSMSQAKSIKKSDFNKFLESVKEQLK